MEKIGEESKKHMCRFCNKSFPCGRSLGGHMRSHVINSTDHHHHEHHDQVKNKIGSSVLDKICKECGKGFQSWKALFGHMKCHSIKLINNKNKKTASLNQDFYTSHSDNENSDLKDRSISRFRNIRNKRYVDTTGSSLISMNVNCNQISSNNASTSMVSEIEQEQEAEVAMSLMMLSRDLGKCGNEFESSNYCYKSSVLLSLRETEGKDSIRNRSKMNKFEETKVGFDFLGRSEVGFDFKNSNKRKFVHDQRFCGQKASHQLKRDFDSKIQNQNRIEHKPVLHHEVTFNGYDLKTSNEHQESSSFNLDVGSLKKKVVLRAHECPICFKTFTSGQALGGHKRSHMISEAKLNQENKTITIKKPVDRVHDTRVFLDLNMLPEEEEMNMSSSTTEYKSYCWDDCSDHHSHESRIMCLLSTS